MEIKKHLRPLFFLLFLSTRPLYSQIILQGDVIDNGSEPVDSALVELIDHEDTGRVFTDYTGPEGHFEIEITETGFKGTPAYNPDDFHLYQNYPNPFNPSTVIVYSLPKPSFIKITIYDILGRKMKTLFQGFRPEGHGRFIWDATDDQGQGVPAGIYIYSLTAEGVRISRKMLLTDGRRNLSPGAVSGSVSLYPADKTYVLSNRYLLRVSGDNLEPWEQSDLDIHSDTTLNIIVNRIVTDIDGNVYRTVKIGDHWWMAENLKVTRYRNGDSIPIVTDNRAWESLTTGAICYFDNDSNNVATYGILYNYYAIDDSRGFAPEGWHIPTDEEWKELETFLGMSRSEADGTGHRGTDEGGRLKEAGTEHWLSPNTGATNETGFTALPGGYRSSTGYMGKIREWALFWAHTEKKDYLAWYRRLEYDRTEIRRIDNYKQHGFSIRCVRD
jgi:uncharacterized protein (TIGR02145 family)